MKNNRMFTLSHLSILPKTTSEGSYSHTKQIKQIFYISKGQRMKKHLTILKIQ